MDKKNKQRRKRRMAESKRLANTASVFSGIGGILAIVLFCLVLGMSSYKAGDLNHIWASIGMVGLLIALASLFFGARGIKEHQFSAGSRVFGLLIPALASILWVGIYLLGLLM